MFDSLDAAILDLNVCLQRLDGKWPGGVGGMIEYEGDRSFPVRSGEQDRCFSKKIRKGVLLRRADFDG